MELLRRTFSQYSKIFEGLASSQKVTLLLVSAIIVAGFGYLMYSNSKNAYVPLFAENTLSADELTNAETGLREQGLSDFKVEAQKIMVPRSKLDQYKAALLVQDGLPSGWAEEMEKQVSNTNIFDNNRNSRTKAKIALNKILRRVLRQVPQIRDANVLWAEDKQRGFPVRSRKVTAAVWLTPEKNHEITSRLVNSIKSAVAMSISGLKKSNVTVFDLSTGKAYSEDEDGSFDGKILEEIKRWEKHKKEKVIEHLSYIPNVLVAVNVELDELKKKIEQINKVNPKEALDISTRSTRTSEIDSSQATQKQPGIVPNKPLSRLSGHGNSRTRTVTGSTTDTKTIATSTRMWKEYLAAMPKATHVSVVIPEDYLTKVTGTGQPPQTRAQILADIKTNVANAVGQDATANTISVTSYIPVDPELPEMEESIMDSVSSSLSQWGGAIGMAVFAVWALLMLKKSFNRLPELPEDPTPASITVPEPSPQDEKNELLEKRETERDKLQTVVRDNPELTAAVISNWLQSAR